MPECDLHLAVALDGAGWLPASWREPDARPSQLFTAGYWSWLVGEAERGLIDFVTFEDSLSLQSADRTGPDERTDQVRGRLDAVLTAARVAPLTRHVGLIPAVTVTHTEELADLMHDWRGVGLSGFRLRPATVPHDLLLITRGTKFVGSPPRVADRLEQLRDVTGADELIISTITHDHADRVCSYQLLAEEWSRR